MTPAIFWRVFFLLCVTWLPTFAQTAQNETTIEAGASGPVNTPPDVQPIVIDDRKRLVFEKIVPAWKSERLSLLKMTESQLQDLEIQLRCAHSDQDIAAGVVEFQRILAHLLNSADERDFISLLKRLEPHTRAIGYRSNLFYNRFLSNQYPQPYAAKSKQGAMVFFSNTYRADSAITEDEKNIYYILEKDSYDTHGLDPVCVLTRESAAELQPEIVYNFAMLTDGTIKYSMDGVEDTLYVINDSGVRIKRLTTPNHTILAENQPVLTAGNFVIWQHDNKRLIFISNKSGHYRPDYDSLEAFRERLSRLGFHRAQVIALGVDVDYTDVLKKARRRDSKRNH